MSQKLSKSQVAMLVHEELSRQSQEAARLAFSGAPTGMLSPADVRDLSRRKELLDARCEAITLPPDLAKEWNRVHGW